MPRATPTNGADFTDETHDRLVIFEDRDGDGVFETRKVIYDRLNRLTGLTIGFGGVWVATAPTVQFIPDRDRNDVPDGDPEVVLDGWTLSAEHNSVNGLFWGPDGWLYGDLNNSHVLPALLRKFHTAKVANIPSVEIWGSGEPMREFLHVDDLAEACYYLMQNRTMSQD